MRQSKKFAVTSFLLIIFYLLLGNARSVKQNPFIPGAVIAVNMIVPVLAGKLGGKRMGAFVGFFATLLNALSPAGSVFEFAAILPHTIMGYVAGSISKSQPIPIVALTLIIGHAFNLLSFIAFGLMQFSVLQNLFFWYGLTYELFYGIITIIIIYFIIQLAFRGRL